MKKIYLLLFVITFPLFNTLQSQTTHKIEGKPQKYKEPLWSMSFYGQFNLFGEGEIHTYKGGDVFRFGFSHGYELGLSVGRKISDIGSLSLGFNYTVNSLRYEFTDDFEKQFWHDFNLYPDKEWDACFCNYYDPFLKYIKFDLNYSFHFVRKRRSLNYYAGLGLSFIHYRPWTSINVSEIWLDSGYVAFLQVSIYQNSRYQMKQHNTYHAIDLGVNFFGGMEQRLYKNHYLTLGMHLMVQPRRTHAIYYEDTPNSQKEYSGKIIQNMSMLGFRMGYVYKF